MSSKRLNISPGRWKVGASSLIETVLAMTILLSILSLGLLNMDRINASLNPSVLYKAHLVSKDAELFDFGEGYLSTTHEIQGFEVHRICQEEQPNLHKIEIQVLDGRGELAYTRLIYVSKDE